MSSEMPKVAILPTSLKIEYEFHPLAEIFPVIEGDEFDALVADIRKQGILEPITLYEGRILDGRNRYRAALEAGHKFSERDFVQLKAGLDPREFVYSTNIQRRHLNTKQKREFVARLIREQPVATDRMIARMASVDHKTVGSVREELAKVAKKLHADWRGFTRQQRKEFVEAFRDEITELLRGSSLDAR
jgi:hypothetical protein